MSNLDEVNVIEKRLAPQKPVILKEQQIDVFVPEAGTDVKGIAKFNAKHFSVKDGTVSLANEVLTHKHIIDILYLSDTSLQVKYNDGSTSTVHVNSSTTSKISDSYFDLVTFDKSSFNLDSESNSYIFQQPFDKDLTNIYIAVTSIDEIEQTEVEYTLYDTIIKSDKHVFIVANEPFNGKMYIFNKGSSYDFRPLLSLADNEPYVNQSQGEAKVRILDFNGGKRFEFSGIKGERGPLGPVGPAFTYDMFTSEQLKALRGPVGPIGKTGPRGEKGSCFLFYSLSIVGSPATIDSRYLWGAADPSAIVGSTIMDTDADIYLIEEAEGNGYYKATSVGINMKGPAGPVGPEGPVGPRGVGIPEGGTEGQVLTKTADGTAWEDAKGGSASPSLLYMSGENSYGRYDIYFKLPTAGAKKITVLYTSQYNGSYYYNEYLNENVVIFDNGQPISGLEFSLLLDNAYDEYGNPLDRAYIPLIWINDSTINFSFYEANNQSYWSGVSMTALFKIEY